MIKIENTDVHGFDAAIRGMRNPKNSWEKSDSYYAVLPPDDKPGFVSTPVFTLGPKDMKLAQTLANAGDDHGKFLRFITVSCDITAPHFWWPEMDQYKVGTVTDSCSKMHTLLDKPFELSDFSFHGFLGMFYTGDILSRLNAMRDMYMKEEDPVQKKYIWRGILEQLPLAYNQKRTWTANYQVLKRIYHARKDHKLMEWHQFCEWITTLPYAKELMGIDGV